MIIFDTHAEQLSSTYCYLDRGPHSSRMVVDLWAGKSFLLTTERRLFQIECFD